MKHLDAFISGHSLYLADGASIGFEAFERISVHLMFTVYTWLTQVRSVLNYVDAFSGICGHRLDFADGRSTDFEAFGRIFDYLWPQSSIG